MLKLTPQCDPGYTLPCAHSALNMLNLNVWRRAQRVALREINVDILVSTLTRRARHKRGRLVTLRREKQGYFSENPTQDQRGSNPGGTHD